MEPEKRPVRVVIFGQAYTVLAEDPAEVEQLARRVDSLMGDIASHGSHDTARTAVLACLHLADELETAERQLSEVKNAVAAKSHQFSILLEKVMES
jgi:cell division protein ZapA